MRTLLDLYCNAGGAGRGYQRAGFHVTGIDIVPQPRYAGDVFIQADALEYVTEHGHEFDVIHASPECQGYSGLQRLKTYDSKAYSRMIGAVREALEKTGKPYIIENVQGARAHMLNPFELCGYTFGLKTYRHRLFDSSHYIIAPTHLKHPEGCPPSGRGASPVHGIISITGNGGFGEPDGFAYAKKAMGIDWCTREELSQMIPPAYTEWIGRQLMMIEGVSA